jgi:hypothetical protein
MESWLQSTADTLVRVQTHLSEHNRHTYQSTQTHLSESYLSLWDYCTWSPGQFWLPFWPFKYSNSTLHPYWRASKFTWYPWNLSYIKVQYSRAQCSLHSRRGTHHFGFNSPIWAPPHSRRPDDGFRSCPCYQTTTELRSKHLLTFQNCLNFLK